MTVEAIWAMRGTTLDTTLSKASTRFCVSAAMSASLDARPVSQLSHAALMALTLPSMVVAASRAVVPPTCMLS